MYSGAFPLYAVIGTPIDNLRSPSLFGASLANKGLPGTMMAFAVGGPGLGEVVAGLRAVENLVGFLVTMPHKESIGRHLDEMSESATMAGAVNIVRRANGRLIGEQLDGAGFVAALLGNGFDPRGRTASIVGAGGVAAGIAVALCGAGITQLTVTNRTESRAVALLARLAERYPEVRLQSGAPGSSTPADLVVNATSMGYNAEDPLPFDVELLLAGTLVADVIAKPTVTPLLKAARARGCRIQSGDAMIAAQLDLMHDFFSK